MRIVFDLTSLDDNFSGIERFTLNISKSLIENAGENEYILIFKNKIHEAFDEIINKKNVKYEIIKSKNKLLASQIKLPKLLYKIKAEKYIFLAFPAPILFFSKGIINAIHDMTAWLYPETMSKKGLILFKALIRKAMLNSSKIITVSQSSKRDIKKIFPKNKIDIQVIYNGLDEKFLEYKKDFIKETEVCKKYKIKSEYLLCLGTIEPRKNIELLIDAYIELKKEKRIVEKLVLVGRKGWKYQSILEKIEKNKIENDIVFTGFVEDEDLPYVYSNAKCFVFPSIYEGFGIPLIEAMSVGTPIIASNTSSIPEVLDSNGILFESNNKEDLKREIEKFLCMNKLNKENMIKDGIVKAKKFKWNEESIKVKRLLEG